MSAKKEMMAKIKKKAQSIRDMRDLAANKDVERYVFDFFKNAEPNDLTSGVDWLLTSMALETLIQQLKTIDPHLRSVTPNFIEGAAVQTVQGVTIHWSLAYAKKNSCDDSAYIDISQILLMP